MKTTPKLIVAAVAAVLSLGFAPTALARGGHSGNIGHHGFHALNHPRGYWQAPHPPISGHSYRPSHYRRYPSAPSYCDERASSCYGWDGRGLSCVTAGHHH